MRILVVTNMLAGANPAAPSQGIFVSEQVAALRKFQAAEVDVEVIAGFKGRLAYLTSLPRIVRAVMTGRYEIVHYHFGLSAWSAPLLRLICNAEIVVTLHGSDICGPAWMAFVTRIAVRFADAVIAVSDEIAARVRQRCRRVEVIPCGVDQDFFAAPERSGTARPGGIIVFPSSPARPEKDYALFSDVLRRMRALLPELPLVEACIDGLSRDEVRDLLLRADLLLMTSQREGSPQVVKKAMACALPVVSVNVGDVGRLLGGVDQCFVAPNRDPEQIAREAAALVLRARRSNGPERLEALGYRASDTARRVMRLYETVRGGDRERVGGTS